ncbi:MAG: RNA polymerase sigma factor [Planctomycetota bacterium JB042]
MVRRCQSSEPEIYEPAFGELYSSYSDRVFNTSFRVVGNAADAADVTQDVFLTVFRKIGEFQFSSRFFTWIYRITVNLSIDRRRRGQSAPGLVLEGGGEANVLNSLPDEEAASPDAWADREFLEGKVQKSIERLSPKLRAIVVLRYIEGLAYGEIAEVMGCSIGTVKSRLNRAHKNLEVFLGPVVEAMSGEDEE